MKYLLDVNALLAWYHPGSPHHNAFHAWAGRQEKRAFATCAVTELGFIRVSMQVFGYSLKQAEDAVDQIRVDCGGFIASAPAPKLAPWATSAAKTTDAYLVQQARAAGLSFATFDRAIRDPAAIRIE
jgi:predicted nucleic acid-binding protein